MGDPRHVRPAAVSEPAAPAAVRLSAAAIAKAEASRSAQAKENEKYNPEKGDCVKILDAHGDNPTPEIVDCKSPEAEYTTGERLTGADAKCESPPYDTSIHFYSGRGYGNYTLCFTKL